MFIAIFTTGVAGAGAGDDDYRHCAGLTNSQSMRSGMT